MTIVAGADFGTLSVRVTLMDSHERIALASASSAYPLQRFDADPLLATQKHEDHMQALADAMREVTSRAAIDGRDIGALACDTTGSSVLFTDEALCPLDDYYLWCDHRAYREAEAITRAAREQQLEAIDWCGGVYSPEWGYAKLLHFLRHNPDKRDRLACAIEHCDMVAATLCGISDLQQLPRSVCAMGHKWMWGERFGGPPSNAFLRSVDPLLDGANDLLAGRYLASDQLAGTLEPSWAKRLGLRPGIPIPVGAIDAHWDAIGAGCGPGDVVNVIGTSTCIIAVAAPDCPPIAGLSGLAFGSVHPALTGIEAGQAATGDVFEAIARRAGTTVGELAESLAGYRPASTGLLRVPWDNGDRTVLARADLHGICLGWRLDHEARDELHAAIEGMACHVRIILERMQEGGVDTSRVINAGGIPQNNALLNTIYANVLEREVRIPASSPVGVGACIMASLAAGAASSIDEAQARMCPRYRTIKPDPATTDTYTTLFTLFRDVYFSFGEHRSADLGAAGNRATDLGAVLPALARLARDA